MFSQGGRGCNCGWEGSGNSSSASRWRRRPSPAAVSGRWRTGPGNIWSGSGPRSWTAITRPSSSPRRSRWHNGSWRQLRSWYAQGLVESLARLRGPGKHHIDYRHVIDWLVRKPGAFVDYRYRSDLLPSSRFHLAYDEQVAQQWTGRRMMPYWKARRSPMSESQGEVRATLVECLKELHLLALRSSYEKLARQAQQESHSYEQYLSGLAQRECQERGRGRSNGCCATRGCRQRRVGWRWT